MDKTESFLAKKLSRNVCEKIRRDRMNYLIQELARAVPLINQCQKKLDKSSILRLTVAQLKLHLGIRKMKMAQGCWRPESIGSTNWCQMLQEAMDGFMFVVSRKGTIILLTEAIGHLLGHNQFDLIGKDIQSIIHPEDEKLFKSQFLPRHASSTCADSLVNTRSCYIRFINGHIKDSISYTMVHIVGQLQEMSLFSRQSNLDNNNDVWLNGVGLLFRQETFRHISFLNLDADEFISQHAMDGKILFTDPRASQITGMLPNENFGASVYQHIIPEDLVIVGRRHKQLITEGETPSTVFRLFTNNKLSYIESRSSIARDSWSKRPMFIVSLNTEISEAEGRRKLQLQMQEDPNMESEDPDKLLSDVLKRASTFKPYQSTTANSFAFTNNGDILNAVNEHGIKTLLSCEPINDCQTETGGSLSSQERSDLSNHDQVISTTTPSSVLDSSVSETRSFQLCSKEHSPSSNSELSEDQSSDNSIETSNQTFDKTNCRDLADCEKTVMEMDIRSQLSGSSELSDNLDGRKDPKYQDILNDLVSSENELKDNNCNILSQFDLPTGSPSITSQIGMSPITVNNSILLDHSCSVNGESDCKPYNNQDEFRVFSNQLNLKHVELSNLLQCQAKDIEKLEIILHQTDEYQHTPKYKILLNRLKLLKENQSSIENELEELKESRSMAEGEHEENKPWSRSTYNNYHNTNQSRSQNKLIGSRRRSADLKDEVSLVCDGYQHVTSEERIKRIKTALTRLPVPRNLLSPKS